MGQTLQHVKRSYRLKESVACNDGNENEKKSDPRRKFGLATTLEALGEHDRM